MSAHTFTPRQKNIIADLVDEATINIAPKMTSRNARELFAIARQLRDAHYLTCYTDYQPSDTREP